GGGGAAGALPAGMGGEAGAGGRDEPAARPAEAGRGRGNCGLRIADCGLGRTGLPPIRNPRTAMLRVRNRIYHRVFDRGWVLLHMPDAEVRRQRSAFRRGLGRAAAVGAVLLAVVGSLAGVAVRERGAAREQLARMDVAAGERLVDEGDL